MRLILLAASIFITLTEFNPAQTKDTISIETKYFGGAARDSMCYFNVYFPFISGLDNKQVETSVNVFLYNAFVDSSMILDLDDCDSLYGFQYDAGFNVWMNTKRFISLEGHYFVYNGGAHGNFGSDAYNIDLSTGNNLMLKDLFKSGGVENLSVIVQQKLEEDFLVDKLSEAGFFEDEILLHDDQTFFVTDSTLAILFNPYEIAPYVMGEQLVEVSLDEIKEFLKPNLPFQSE
jgi:hypothetical protein